jgi:alpha-beta hydrolase superfamily lysophospholipase
MGFIASSGSLGGRLLRRLLRYLIFGVALLLAVLYAASTTWPEPEIWHAASLDEEFSRDRLGEVGTFDAYRALEDRLFEQARKEIYARTPSGPNHRFERFSAGSSSDPTSRSPNWNRSFELTAEDPRGAVLLLHGMSDSPYSLHAIGETLHARGYRVLGLRLPGHGTAPSGLLNVRWQDMAAAVRLAMQHLAGTDIHIIGYSTGAPLALNYVLDAEQDAGLPMPASLVLLSPAIGVSPAAALATWKRRLSMLPGLDHLAWLDMLPEFDPYKYNSFTTNAGEQVYLLTQHLASRIVARTRAAPAPLPPILALKSTVDATVSNEAVVDRLLIHLAPGRHEYLLFDINRRAANASLLVSDPGPFTRRMLDDPGLPFTVTVVSNREADSDDVVARSKPPFATAVQEEKTLGALWPRGILSLSHIALPFPPDDPLYGRENPGREGQVFLGLVTIQGERGLLRFPSDWLIRLRHNPFYDYLEQRVVDWLAAAEQGIE